MLFNPDEGLDREPASAQTSDAAERPLDFDHLPWFATRIVAFLHLRLPILDQYLFTRPEAQEFLLVMLVLIEM